ncbi:urea carboxylase-associated family protein [Nocardiopsis halotolerans]|uniref:urea carboxylase-associated family protein n=1 Tax=Nocardiopsis halotolerans TaxID=124252 RepID=UPI000346E77A|nr:urea carboxylase-associated family protein [Nocardiopsis halotolerans]
MSPVTTSYQPTRDGILDVDVPFYDRLAGDTDGRELVERFVIPIRSGRAWEVPAGHLCRVITPEGAQAGDFNVWNRHNPRERLWAARTRQLQGAHVTRHDRLWSTLPYLRPLLTITNDSLEWYGVDEDGARVHDLLGSRCDPYVNRILTGEDFDFHCHSNLTRAVLPYGLTEFDVHDVLNLFTVTGLDGDDRYYMKPSPARAGDFVEFFAEQDLLCALSTCPAGDLSVPFWGPDARDPVDVCRPLAVEVHRPAPELTEGWSTPHTAPYRGMHGMTPPSWSDRQASRDGEG